MATNQNSQMLYREIGSTGEKVSAIGLGAWYIGLLSVDEELGLKIIRMAIDRGLTFTFFTFHQLF